MFGKKNALITKNVNIDLETFNLESPPCKIYEALFPFFPSDVIVSLCAETVKQIVGRGLNYPHHPYAKGVVVQWIGRQGPVLTQTEPATA